MKKAKPLIIVFVFLSLVGCTWMYYASDVPVSYVEMPFAVHQAGAVAETELRVIKRQGYIFELLFFYKDSKDRARIEKLVTSNFFREPYLDIPLEFKIARIDENRKVISVDKATVTVGASTGEGFIGREKYGALGYYDREIIGMPLKPGLYRISVKSIKNIPELAAIPISFAIRIAPRV
jgi:hypothetical protein